MLKFYENLIYENLRKLMWRNCADCDKIIMELWSQPSFTIQASGRQAPIHPAGEPMVHVGKDKYIFSDGEENNRRLSVNEIARIQTFPDWYEFSRGTNFVEFKYSDNKTY